MYIRSCASNRGIRSTLLTARTTGLPRSTSRSVAAMHVASKSVASTILTQSAGARARIGSTQSRTPRAAPRTSSLAACKLPSLRSTHRGRSRPSGRPGKTCFVVRVSAVTSPQNSRRRGVAVLRASASPRRGPLTRRRRRRRRRVRRRRPRRGGGAAPTSGARAPSRAPAPPARREGAASPSPLQQRELRDVTCPLLRSHDGGNLAAEGHAPRGGAAATNRAARVLVGVGGARAPRRLRHDAARRRAEPGRDDDWRGEGLDREVALAPRRRRVRGGLPDRVERRLRGREGRGRDRGPPHRGPRPGVENDADRLPVARQREGHRAVLRRGAPRAAAPGAHVHRVVRDPPEAQAEHHAGAVPRDGGGDGRVRARAVEHAGGPRRGVRHRVLGGGLGAQRPRLPRRAVHRGDRGGRHDDQPARHGRLHGARGVRVALCVRRALRRNSDAIREASPAPPRNFFSSSHPRRAQVPDREHRDARQADRVVDALPQRPRPRHRQLARRGAAGRAADRGDAQRHRRARGEHVARGVRDGAAHAAGALPRLLRHRH